MGLSVSAGVRTYTRIETRLEDAMSPTTALGINKLAHGLAIMGLCLLAAACSDGADRPAATAAASGQAEPATVHRWKLITTWPKNLPALGTAPERLADDLREMSGGRLDIRVYGAGELVGAFEVFDAVSQGTAVE